MGIYDNEKPTQVLRDHMGNFDASVFNTSIGDSIEHYGKRVLEGAAMAAPKFAFDVARPGIFATNELLNIPEDEQLNVRNLLEMMGHEIPPEEIGNSFWDLVSLGDQEAKDSIDGTTKFTADFIPMVTTVGGLTSGIKSKLLNPGALLSRSATVGKISHYLNRTGTLGKFGIEAGANVTADIAGSILHFNGDEETIMSQIPEEYRPGFMEFLVGEKDDEWYVTMMKQSIENGLVSFGFEGALQLLKMTKISKAIAKEVSDDPQIQNQAVMEFLGSPSDYDEHIVNNTTVGKILDEDDFTEDVVVSAMDSHREVSQAVQERKLRKAKRRAKKKSKMYRQQNKDRVYRETKYQNTVKAKDPFPEIESDVFEGHAKQSGKIAPDASPEEIADFAEKTLKVDSGGIKQQKLTWETSLKPELSRLERKLNTLDDLSSQVDNIKQLIKGTKLDRDKLANSLALMEEGTEIFKKTSRELDKLERNLNAYPKQLEKAKNVRYKAVESIMDGDARFVSDLVDGVKVKLEDIRRGLKASGLSEKEVTQILDNTSKNPARALKLINRAIESVDQAKAPAIKRLKKDMKKIERTLGDFSRDARERIISLDPTKTPSFASIIRSTDEFDKLKRVSKSDELTDAELAAAIKDPNHPITKASVEFGMTSKQALIAGQQLKAMNLNVELTFKKLLQDFQLTTNNLTTLAKAIQTQGGVTKADKRMIHQYIATLAGWHQYVDVIYGTKAKDGLSSTYGRNMRQMGMDQTGGSGRALSEQLMKFHRDSAKGELKDQTVLDYLTGTSKDAEANDVVGNLLVSLESSGSLQELHKNISKVASAKKGTSFKEMSKRVSVKSLGDWFEAHMFASYLSGFKTLFGSIFVGGVIKTVWQNTVQKAFEGLAQGSLSAAVKEPLIASKAMWDVMTKGTSAVFDGSGRSLGEKAEAIIALSGGAPVKSEMADTMQVNSMSEAWRGISETAEMYHEKGAYGKWAMTRIMQPLMTPSARVGSGISNFIDYVDKVNRGAAFNASIAVDAYRQAKNLPPGMLAKGEGTFVEKYTKTLKSYQEIVESGSNPAVIDAEITLLTEGDKDLARVLNESYNSALKDADSAVFQSSLDDTLLAPMHSMIQGISNHSTGARVAKAIMLPFYKTPVNILQEAVELVPGFNYATSRLRNQLHHGTPQQKIQATAKIWMSAALGVTAYGAYHAGLIRGNIPVHERESAKAKGYKANVIVVGDAQIEFDRLGHLGTVLGIYADVFKAQDEATAEEGVMTAMGASLSAMMSSQSERSYMKSVKEGLAILTGEKSGLAFTQNRLASAVNPVAGAQKSVIEFFSDNIKDEPALDPEATDAITRFRSGLDKIFQNNILWRNTVGEYQMQVDALGRPVYSHDSGIGAHLAHMAGFSYKTSDNDPLVNALAKHGLIDNSGTTTIEGIKLTKRQYKKLNNILWRGNKLEDQLRDVTNSTAYMAAPSIQQKRFLEGQLKQYKEFAKQLLIEENPQLAIDIQAEKMARVADEFGLFDASDRYSDDGIHQKNIKNRIEDTFKRDYRERVYEQYGLK